MEANVKDASPVQLVTITASLIHKTLAASRRHVIPEYRHGGMIIYVVCAVFVSSNLQLACDCESGR